MGPSQLPGSPNCPTPKRPPSTRQALAKWIPQPQGAEFCSVPDASALGPNSALTLQRNHHVVKQAYAGNIFRLGVLQLRLHRFEITHLEVVASRVGYLKVLQDRIYA